MSYTYMPQEQEIFTEREVQHILSKIESIGTTSLVCRLDGITWYEIERIKNNEKKMAQYNVSLHCHYANNFESFTQTLSYVETLNFLRAFKTITYYYNP